MRVLPGMTVIVPADGFETKQTIDTVAEYEGPVYVRLGRSKVPSVMPEDYKFTIGKAYVWSIGKDATIVAAGIMVASALEAKEMLAKEGIDAGVINMSTIKPLDGEALLTAAGKSKLILTAEEHSIIGGLGSAVSEFLSEHHPIKIVKLGIRDTFGCSGSPKELVQLYGLTAGNMVDIIKDNLR
jgi:transketolase